jgi:hypothetical protein
MASPRAIRELRYLSGTTRNTSYTAASNAAWAPGTAAKLRPMDYDASGLVQGSEADTTHQQRFYSRPANIATTRNGSFSFSTYLGAAESDESENPVATLLSKIMGGIASPGAGGRSQTLDSSGTHTTTRIFAAGIDSDAAVGQAVLVNGEARSITATGSDYVDLNMALSAAPSDGDTATISTTVYLDEDATQEYLDFLAIGHATADQRQMLACQCTGLELQGLGVGELPKLGYSMGVNDWQWVPSGERDALESTSASQGNDPPVNRGLGGLFFGDHGSTTRAAVKGAISGIGNLIAYQDVPDHTGANGIGGWQKMPIGDGITASFSMLFDEDMDGLYTDFNTPTAKQFIFQLGSTAQKCCAIELQRCYLLATPTETDVSGLQGVEVSVSADEGTTTTNDLTRAALRFHWF